MIQACCTFLESQLDPSNALGIAAFAEQHHCSNLFKAANDFIDQHFIQVYLCECYKRQNTKHQYSFSLGLSRRRILAT